MKVDGSFLVDARPEDMVRAAVAAEDRGYDGWFSTDSSHDAFIPVALASQLTQRITLGTAVAVAFARSPMSVAYVANDLQLVSHGRFVLGLGSQVRAHVTRRFSMQWSRPTVRMKEYVRALHAIWSSWNEEKPLRFEGEFYRFDLMPPSFTPPPNRYGRPPVYVAALGPRMAEAAATVADGVILHPFTTPRYLADVTWPALERGLRASGRSRHDLEVVLPAFAVVGSGDDELRTNADATRARLAFYGSTPAYRAVLEHEGFGELHASLHQASRRGEWEAMAAAFSDGLLQRFAPVGSPQEVGAQLVARFGATVDRISFYTPYEVAPGVLDATKAAIRGG